MLELAVAFGIGEEPKYEFLAFACCCGLSTTISSPNWRKLHKRVIAGAANHEIQERTRESAFSELGIGETLAAGVESAEHIEAIYAALILREDKGSDWRIEKTKTS